MEKINHIEINNFKSIKHLLINDCNRINVFIGMPNAGKSNIIEALAISGMVLNNQNRLDDFIRLEKKADLFFEENIYDKIEFKINSYDIECDYKNEFKLILQTISQSIDLNNFWNTIGFEIKKYHFTNIKFQEKESKSLSFPNGENLVQILATNPKIRTAVNELFKNDNLKLLIDKVTNDLKIFKEYQDGTVFTLPYKLIADTLQRLVFFKVAILSNSENVLLFEEPEAHCFEPYVLEFTNTVKNDLNKNQFFIVTHSDYVLQEFLRDDESKNDTNVFLVKNIDGETQIKLLDKAKNSDVFELGMNPFFNFEVLWEIN